MRPSLPPFCRHGVVPPSIVGLEHLQRGGRRFSAYAISVFRQSNLAHQGDQVLAVSNQPLQQTFVHRQILRRRIVPEHALVFAFAEHLDFLMPDGDLREHPQLRIVT